MIKMLERPENFPNFFSSKYLKKDEMLLATGVKHFHKSLVIVKYYVAS